MFQFAGVGEVWSSEFEEALQHTTATIAQRFQKWCYKETSTGTKNNYLKKCFSNTATFDVRHPKLWRWCWEGLWTRLVSEPRFNIIDVVMVSAMGPPGGGRTFITERPWTAWRAEEWRGGGRLPGSHQRTKAWSGTTARLELSRKALPWQLNGGGQCGAKSWAKFPHRVLAGSKPNTKYSEVIR